MRTKIGARYYLLVAVVALTALSAAGQLPQIVTQPLSRTIRLTSAGLSEYLNVGVTSDSPPSFQWRKDQVYLPGQLSENLWLTNLTPADAGGYDVIVRNPFGSVTSQVAQLTIVVPPPTFDTQPAGAEIAAGNAYYLFASVVAFEPGFQWFKNGWPLTGATDQSLTLSSQFTDTGDYQLVATNLGGSATSQVAHVEVKPLLLSGPYCYSALLSNTVHLSVYASSSVHVDYQWFFNQQPMPGMDTDYLDLPAANSSHQGDYFVVASNCYGMATSQVAILILSNQAPTVQIHPGRPPSQDAARAEALLGQSVTLWAEAFGGPPPQLQWRWNDQPLAGQTNTVLYLPAANLSDAGAYTCVALNSSGAVTSAPVTLTVLAKAPQFFLTSQHTNEVEGSMVALRSYASAGPPATYQWRRDGRDLPGQTNRVLWFPRATLADSGLYEVVASNSLGQARWTNVLTIRPATGLDRWEWRLPQPQGSRLFSLASGNGRLVAVGKAANLLTSTDGLNWTPVALEFNGDVEKVVFGNGRFVATAHMRSPVFVPMSPFFDADPYFGNDLGLVLSSADGLNWTAQPAPAEAPFASLAFGNGQFIACSRPETIYTSIDGLHWTTQILPGKSNFRVGWANGLYLASAGSELFISSNATQWVRAGTTAGAQAFTYGQGRWIGMAYRWVDVSTDGVHWKSYGIDTELGGGPFAIAASPSRFVASLPYPIGQVGVSTDGVHWSAVDTGADQEIEGVTYIDNQFWAVGEAGTIITSTDGLAWSPSQAANQGDFYGVTRGGNLLVAAGDAGAIFTSTDAHTWTKRTTPGSRNLHAVHYANGLYVAGGRKGALFTSPDGINWTTAASGVTNYISRIAWANGQWVAVAEHGDITVSSDALHWTPVNTGVPFTDHEGIAYGQGVWVAAGGYFTEDNGHAVTTIFYSTNALQWFRPFAWAGVRLRDVAFGGGLFLAVGNDAALMCSTNGINFENVRMSPQLYLASPAGYANFRRVVYAHGRFVAVGNDGALFSASNPLDPASWRCHRSRTSQNLRDLVDAADGTFVAAGNNRMILQSANIQPRFTGVRQVLNGLLLDIDPGIAEGGLVLEATTDFHSWQTVATNRATGPLQVPIANQPAQFFRLVAP